MRLKFAIPAPDEHSRFERGCFDKMMGERLPINVDGLRREAMVIGIEYPEGGREVLLTVDWRPR